MTQECNSAESSWPEGGLPHGEHPYDYGYGTSNAASDSRTVRVWQKTRARRVDRAIELLRRAIAEADEAGDEELMRALSHLILWRRNYPA